ncbi:MAG TPA: DUF998 domain-containing protein [Kineosporiaceae bacterium]|nr:DUF998 domain-containing protein [Kineosporiaceae bacterium]
MGASVPAVGGRPCAGLSPSRSADLLLGCGAAAGPLFISTFVIEGALRADYDSRRHPVSSLALGERGWVQRLNFYVAGGLYLAGAVGLARTQRAADGGLGVSGRLVPPLIAAAAAGLIGAGSFDTDPVSGYPPGTPPASAGYTRSGALHDLLSIPTFLGIPAAALLSAVGSARRGRVGWATFSAASGLGMLAGTGAASAAFGQAPKLVAYGGLLQRAAVTSGFAWLTAVHLRALRGR